MGFSMKSAQFLKLILLTIVSLIPFQNGFACSGYKVTLGNKTLFGSNEDAWRVSPHIWFENGIGKANYGAGFTGSRYDGENGYAPQSGMNEMGLVFERLSSYHPQSKKVANRKPITNPTKYLKDILHRCKTVEEVQEYIRKYDHSYFTEDIFIYVDKSGKYLIVEPYKLTIGNDPSYVISNFCPSITSKQDANQLERYRNGVAFLRNNIDTTLAFCAALSDTMHVCRKKIGDGTLLTSIWDLNNGTVNLYFYHSYKATVQFNLKEELGKGDHLIAIETLFRKNSEFEKLRNYKNPKNSSLIALFLVASAGLFLFSSIYFLIRYFRRKQNSKYRYIQVLMFLLGLVLFCYLVVLCVGSVNRFYFPAPYKDRVSVFISLTSYIPFLLLLIIIPFCVINYKLFKEKSWSKFSKGLFTLNNVATIILIGLFVYWGFYDVFN
jgi:hypothetical protein